MHVSRTFSPPSTTVRVQHADYAQLEQDTHFATPNGQLGANRVAAPEIKPSRLNSTDKSRSPERSARVGWWLATQTSPLTKKAGNIQ
uniref:Uncharacterized protein n=1 Tax=Gibberella zeae TaxID=5518 RepID=A0A4E9E9Q2_GIBZA